MLIESVSPHVVETSGATTQAALVGRHARAVRRARGLTLGALAERADLSKGHLSRFERGEKALSVAALLRLAQALGTSVGRLLGEEVAAEEIHVSRRAERPVLTSAEAGLTYRYSLVSGGDGVDGGRNVFLLELDAGGQRASTVVHAGDELLFVLDGRLVVTVGGREFMLEPSDYVEFPGRVPHVVSSLSEASRCLVVVLRNEGAGME